MPLKVCKTGLKADFKAASCVFNLICLRLTNRCQVPRHGVISDGILRSASVALKSMSHLGLKVVEASFMKIFTQQGMSLPLKPPVSRFVATALASRKTGAARFSGTCVFRSWSTIRVGLEDGVFSFWIASFFLPGSLRGCFSATTSVAKSEVSARGISASYLLMMSGSGFITP